VSIELLERAAGRLGPIVAEVAFLGGASFVLWTDDPGAPEPRTTVDVDVIVLLDTYADYTRLGDRLRARGLQEDATSRVLCRWRDADGLVVDVMPTGEAILGFTNRWYPEAIAAAVEGALPSGATIRAVTPPLLLATKLEAFANRGRGDYLASVDFEDVVRLVDGRERLVDEMSAASAEVRAFVADELARMAADPGFEGGVAGALLPDAASQARRALVLSRLERIAAAGA
jgi:predicted nucleotidyltransferase